jgi:hypothetical protein
MQKELKMEDSLRSLIEKHLNSLHKIKITCQGHRKSQGIFELFTLGCVTIHILKKTDTKKHQKENHILGLG